MEDLNLRRWSRLRHVTKVLNAFKRTASAMLGKKIGPNGANKREGITNTQPKGPFNYIDYLGVPSPWTVSPLLKVNNNETLNCDHNKTEGAPKKLSKRKIRHV